MGFFTQRLFENNVHISDAIALTADDPTQYAVVGGEPQPRIFTINKQIDKLHIVFEAVTAWSDPIAGADVDVFIYHDTDQSAAYYEKLSFNSLDGRIAVVLDHFMGVKFVYLRQNAGTVVKAQVIFE